jgi:hypothetical protein
MKKTFNLSHKKIKLPRLVDAIKHEVKKYIKRERRRALPEDADYWDFDCRFGVDEESSEVIHVSEINKSISWAESEKLDSFYLEVMVKPCRRNRAPEIES